MSFPQIGGDKGADEGFLGVLKRQDVASTSMWQDAASTGIGRFILTLFLTSMGAPFL